MSQLTIAFIGIGSIGKRHLGNVTTVLRGRGVNYEIDLYRSDLSRELPAEIRSLATAEYLYADGPQKEYDIVFVTNPTFLHYEALEKFRDNTKSFFIEKPVFDKTEVDLDIFKSLEGIDCYVACPLRFHPVIQYVKENINVKNVLSARAISSSYLPEWRPNQDYRKCFCSHRDMGGGVGIDLIHEWDYLTCLFGMPVTLYSIQEKISNLEIDSDDLAIYIAKTENTSIELHLDYFGRQSIRTLDLYMTDDTVHCDLLAGTVSFLKSGKTVSMPVERNAYQIAEIEHFLEIIHHKTPNDNTPLHAFEVLKLAKGEF